MLVIREKPSRHLTSMLFWLWTLHNKLSEKTKALSILSLTNMIQAKFLMKTLLLALVKPMFADRQWYLQSWETWEKAALHPHPSVNKTVPLWTFLFCSVFCIWTARSSEVRTPLKNFFPPPQLVLFNSVITESSFHNTFPSRLEEFYSVKQTKQKLPPSATSAPCVYWLLHISYSMIIVFPLCLSSAWRFLKGGILFSSASSVLSPGPFTYEQLVRLVMINLLAPPQAKHIWTALEIKLCLPAKTYQSPNPLYLWPYLEVRSLPEKRRRETQEGQVIMEEEIRII